ncbi:hypothetical protein ACU4GD_14160 [Cupriavidus basilensis]
MNANYDVLIIGAGLSGIGMACHLAESTSGQARRHPGAAQCHRRDMGPVPVSRAKACAAVAPLPHAVVQVHGHVDLVINNAGVALGGNLRGGQRG